MPLNRPGSEVNKPSAGRRTELMKAALVALAAFGLVSAALPAPARGGGHGGGGHRGGGGGHRGEGVHRGGAARDGAARGDGRREGARGGEGFERGRFAGADMGRDRFGHDGLHRWDGFHDGWRRWDGNNRWGHWGGWARPWHRWWGGGWGVPYYGWGNGYSVNINNTTVDEEGSLYPARQYTYAPAQVQNYQWPEGGQDAAHLAVNSSAPKANSSSQSKPDDSRPDNAADDKLAQLNSVYQLGPDADLLSSGKIALQLTEHAYLMPGIDGIDVVDQASGLSVMKLHRDQALYAHLVSEVKRQLHGLQAAAEDRKSSLVWSGDHLDGDNSEDGQAMAKMQSTIALLEKAQAMLSAPGSDAGVGAASDPIPALADCVEIFASTWMTRDGKFIVLQRANGSFVYLDKAGVFSDRGQAKLNLPYPTAFRGIVKEYLTTLVGESQSTIANLQQDEQDAQKRLASLASASGADPGASSAGSGSDAGASSAGSGSDAGASSLGSGGDPGDDSDSASAPRELGPTDKKIKRRLAAIEDQLKQVPQETAVAQKLLQTLG